MQAVKELAVIHALVHTGDKYTKVPVDVYTDSLSLFNTLDADGIVQPNEVGAAVQELREMSHDGAMRTIRWLSARGQLADALTKASRSTPLEQTVGSGYYGVRLDEEDYLTKTSSSAPTLMAAVTKDDFDHDEDADQDCIIDHAGNDRNDEDHPVWNECQ